MISKTDMEVFKTVNEIQDHLSRHKFKTIGFVPTMGALHNAHISLVEISKKENDLTVCSIFVNPRQFNKKEDLENYPRNIASDLEKLHLADCAVAFIPSVIEMYPKKIEKEFDFGVLSEVMEAKYRSGHFNGVAMVIERFFEILNPTNAYFGEKDYQQLAVIKALVKQLNSEVNIVGCPIHREANGLAMSSRNERLTEQEKEIASEISRALIYVSQNKERHSVSELKNYFLTKLSENKLFETEYFEIADKETLLPVSDWTDSKTYMAFAAVNINGIRLIDNMTIIK